MADPGSWAMIIAAIAGAGFSAYSAVTAPGAPTYSAPPPPPNSVVYGDNGEILSRQVFDKATSTWTTYGANAEPPRPANEWVAKITGDYAKDTQDPVVKAEVERRFQEHVAADPVGVEAHSGGWRAEEYGNMQRAVPQLIEQYNKDLADYNEKYSKWQTDKADREVENAKLKELRSTALSNLNELTPERQAQIEKFGTDFAASMRNETDQQYHKIDQATDEKANAMGMFGSRAYVDTKNELTKDKMDTETQIAQQATMAKEQLSQADRQYWANLLNQIDAGQRSDLLTSANIAKANADTTNQNYAGTLGYYNSLNVPKLAKWQNDLSRNASYTSAGTNLAGGLMYLYGMKPGGGGSNFNIAPTQTSAGKYSLMG